jgi:hypothetical protein
LGQHQGSLQLSAGLQPMGTDQSGVGTKNRNHTPGGINEAHNVQIQR